MPRQLHALSHPNPQVFRQPVVDDHLGQARQEIARRSISAGNCDQCRLTSPRCSRGRLRRPHHFGGCPSRNVGKTPKRRLGVGLQPPGVEPRHYRVSAQPPRPRLGLAPLAAHRISRLAFCGFSIGPGTRGFVSSSFACSSLVPRSLFPQRTVPQRIVPRSLVPRGTRANAVGDVDQHFRHCPPTQPLRRLPPRRRRLRIENHPVALQRQVLRVTHCNHPQAQVLQSPGRAQQPVQFLTCGDRLGPRSQPRLGPRHQQGVDAGGA